MGSETNHKRQLSPEFLERGKNALFQVVEEDNCRWMAIIYRGPNFSKKSIPFVDPT
jgi:hypothetical protein